MRFYLLSVSLFCICVPHAVFGQVHAPEYSGYAEADYFVDPTLGNDANDGSVGSPWASLDPVLTLTSESVVHVRSGHYGSINITSVPIRTQYVTIRNYPGETPVLDGIAIDLTGKAPAYLRFIGFDIKPTSFYPGGLISLDKVTDVEIYNSDIEPVKYARASGIPGAPESADGVYATDVDRITIRKSTISNVTVGMTFAGSTDCIISDNYIGVQSSSGIKYFSNNSNFLIERNHIVGIPYVPYPTDPDAPDIDHSHQSMISIRSGDLTIRNNIMHGLGSSSGMMFYLPDGGNPITAYSNITIEGNYVYDVENSYILRMYLAGTNIYIRNNLFVGHYRLNAGCAVDGVTNDARYRYETALAVHSLADGYDGSGIHIENNILVGTAYMPATVIEHNNLIWSYGNEVDFQSVTPSGTGAVVTASYLGCGNAPTYFESGFFDDEPNFAPLHGIVQNMRPTLTSPAFNGGDTLYQSDYVLGGLDIDDVFVVDTGLRVSDHSIGPFDLSIPEIQSLTASSSYATTTISWLTNLATDARLDFGTSTSYTYSTTSGSLSTSHDFTIGGLERDTVYHYRVVSVDGLGNIATSSNRTLDTFDDTVPEVVLTAPIAGESVFGSQVYLSATTTDDVAVAGVQFKVDGEPVGDEVTFAPYVMHWNTTGNTGSHTVTAVTRDTSNNYATATPVTVTVTSVEIQYLQPGVGFTGTTTQPENTGNQRSGGYNENAIARWDVVPHQTFSETINVGVVAFHMNGIEKVSFSVNGGTWIDVLSMTRNPETNVDEYWVSLRASDFPDGLIEVRAIVYPITGVPRVLQGSMSTSTQETGNFSMWLYANSDGSYSTSYLYVSPSSGNDITGDGSEGAPYATLYHALDMVENGQTIRLLEEGTYTVPSVVGGPRYAFPYDYSNWTTVESDPSVNPYNVIITGGDSRWRINRIRLHNVSFDVTNGPVYIDQNWFGWADHVRFFDSASWSHPGSIMRSSYVGGIYANDSSGSHVQYGFTGFAIVRNSILDHVSNDDYTNAKVVINSSIDTQEVIIPETHNDVNQYWGSTPTIPVQNIIVYGERGINLSDTQDIFLDRTSSSFRDIAFIDISIGNVPGRTDPPFSQLAASERHILLRNINLPNQALIFRPDFSGDEKYVSEYVIIEDSVFSNTLSSVPSGTHVVNCETTEGISYGSSTPFDVVVPAISSITSSDVENTSFTVHVTATDNRALSATPYVYHNVTLGTYSDAMSNTEYLYTNLSAGSSYTIEVIVTDNIGNYATSSADIVTTAPSSGGGGGGGGSSSKKKTTATTTATTTTPVTTSSDPVIQRLLTLLATLRAQLAQLLAQKQGTTPVSTITRDLTLGMEGEDVRTLQKYLNTHGYTITTTGPGSPNNETTRFGPATHSAVIRFQNNHLTELGIRNGTGYVGEKTRGVMGW